MPAHLPVGRIPCPESTIGYRPHPILWRPGHTRTQRITKIPAPQRPGSRFLAACLTTDPAECKPRSSVRLCVRKGRAEAKLRVGTRAWPAVCHPRLVCYMRRVPWVGPNPKNLAVWSQEKALPFTPHLFKANCRPPPLPPSLMALLQAYTDSQVVYQCSNSGVTAPAWVSAHPGSAPPILVASSLFCFRLQSRLVSCRNTIQTDRHMELQWAAGKMGKTGKTAAGKMGKRAAQPHTANQPHTRPHTRQPDRCSA